MRERRFGRTGWRVSEVGYGMWGMGGWTGSDDDESLALPPWYKENLHAFERSTAQSGG